MPGGVVLGLVVLLGFVAWGAVLFWRGRIVDRSGKQVQRFASATEPAELATTIEKLL